MFYIATRKQPSTIYEAREVTKDNYGVTFSPIHNGYWDLNNKMFVPWSNVDYIQELVNTDTHAQVA